MLGGFVVLSVMLILVKLTTFNTVNGESITDPQVGMKNIGQYPYIASLEIERSWLPAHTCAGVIIREDVILTAAHCTMNVSLVRRENNLPESFPANRLSVRVGAFNINESLTEPNIQIRQVSGYTIHPDFRKLDDFGNDIAIVWVYPKFEIGDLVKPIKLTDQDYAGETAFTLGWVNDINEKQLDYLTGEHLVLLNDLHCERYLAQSGRNYTTSMICGPDKIQTRCIGESGSPLVIHGNNDTDNHILLGISSWGYYKVENLTGIKIISHQKCYPGPQSTVFVKISKFKKWIDDEISNVTIIKNVGQYPYIAFLELKDSKLPEQICTGAIIKVNIILAAAHCTMNNTRKGSNYIRYISPSELTVSAGTFTKKHSLARSIQIRNVFKYVIHPDFFTDNYNSDIAIIWIYPEFHLGKFVNTIELADQFQIQQKPFTLGWRSNKDSEYPDLLVRKDLGLLDDLQCNSSVTLSKRIYTTSMVCAFDKDNTQDKMGSTECIEDFAGPLVIRKFNKTRDDALLGISTGGEYYDVYSHRTLHFTITRGYKCNPFSKTAVFAKIPKLKKWLEDNINYEIKNTGQYPYVASLEIKESEIPEQMCAGAIIKDNILLTAAHCTMNISGHEDNANEYLPPNRLVVKAGTFMKENSTRQHAQERDVFNYTIHPDFHKDYYNNDIAIVWVHPNFNLGGAVKAIQLADKFYIHPNAFTLGWVKNTEEKHPDIPMRRDLGLLTDSHCKTTLTRTRRNYTTSLICAFDKHEGDEKETERLGQSGSPLVIHDYEAGDDVLLGIATWGMHYVLDRPDGVKIVRGYKSDQYSEKPVFAKITELRNWLDANINYVMENVGQYPYIASLEIQGAKLYDQVCPGVIVKDNAILTAAHCIVHTSRNDNSITGYIPPYRLTVRVGTFNINQITGQHVQFRDVLNYTIHPDFNNDYYNNDIAIFWVYSKFDLGKFVKPIQLADQFYEPNEAFTLGWEEKGNGEHPHILMRNEFEVSYYLYCKRTLNASNINYTKYIFCAHDIRGKIKRTGQSDNLLVIPKGSDGKDDVLLGISTWTQYDILKKPEGILIVKDNEYDQYSEDPVFAKIPKFKNWIEDTISNRELEN